MGVIDNALGLANKVNNFRHSRVGQLVFGTMDDVVYNDREKASDTQLLYGTNMSHRQKELERIQVQKEVLRSDFESWIDSKKGKVPVEGRKFIEKKAHRYGWSIDMDIDYEGHQVFYIYSKKYEEWMWNNDIPRESFKGFEICKITITQSMWNNSMWIAWITDLNQFIQ